MVTSSAAGKEEKTAAEEASICLGASKEEEAKEKTNEAPILPWDMSLEECERITNKRVKEHFKPKKPEKTDKLINPGELKFLLECVNQIRENSFRKICLQTMTV
jgi:hypothetical protein